MPFRTPLKMLVLCAFLRLCSSLINFFRILVLFAGPVTVPMVSQSGSPPIPMPVQVPPGHVMQQIVDENGTLRHVILSTQHQQMQSGVQGVQHHIHGHYVSQVRFLLKPCWKELFEYLLGEKFSLKFIDSVYFVAARCAGKSKINFHTTFNNDDDKNIFLNPLNFSFKYFAEMSTMRCKLCAAAGAKKCATFCVNFAYWKCGFY